MYKFNDLYMYLVYQPKVDLNTLEIVGLEALIRFFNPISQKILNTEDIINLITDINDMIELTNYVFDSVISDIKMLDKLNCNINISINMSSKEICNKNFVAWIDKKLRKYKENINRIEIEITEKYEVKDETVMKNRINLLRDLGFFLSIDDLGSGFNQIEMIKKYDVDLIKVDKSLVNKFDDRNKELKYIVSTSKQKDIKLLIEGIECEKDLKKFLDLGFEIGQGYYFYKPMKLNEVLEKTNLLKESSL
ncbi:EAL domain-containing protein [Clostridium perfringens]|uniref:EAL domain-containing protein n=1 Tax=Clostridium perfringens TaxID=1502 RepID=UPI000DA4064A|nr:EAL domain-containing protein [Clostridium perfringens]SQI05410.1 signaling protein [Clostridium perfringens]